MILFRPLIRYADFKGRASRGEYWLFGLLQGFWYFLLIGLATLSMGHSDTDKASTGVLIAFGLIVVSIFALIVPNYAVLTRRLHDSGRGAIWLCLMLPSILSSVMTIGTIVTAVSAVGMGASRDAFLGTALAGLRRGGPAGHDRHGLPGGAGDPDPPARHAGRERFRPRPARSEPALRRRRRRASSLDEARLDALFAEAKRANGTADAPYKPVFDFGPGPGASAPAPAPHPPVDWGGPAPSNGIAPAPTFGRRGL